MVQGTKGDDLIKDWGDGQNIVMVLISDTSTSDDVKANNNEIFGKGGNDIIFGYAGGDRISGGEGNDFIDGGADGTADHMDMHLKMMLSILKSKLYCKDLQ